MRRELLTFGCLTIVIGLVVCSCGTNYDDLFEKAALPDKAAKDKDGTGVPAIMGMEVGEWTHAIMPGDPGYEEAAVGNWPWRNSPPAPE